MMPTVTKNLIIINVLVFFGTLVAQRYGIDLANYLGLHFFLASDFNPAQLITYMFMHGGFSHIFFNMFMHGGFSHIFFNMFAVFMFGPILEQTWGPKRFLFYYILCGIGAGLIQEGVQYIQYITELSQHTEVNLIGYGIISMDQYLNMMTTVGAFRSGNTSTSVWSRLRHFAGIRNVVSQQPTVYLSAAFPYQG